MTAGLPPIRAARATTAGSLPSRSRTVVTSERSSSGDAELADVLDHGEVGADPRRWVSTSAGTRPESRLASNAAIFFSAAFSSATSVGDALGQLLARGLRGSR